jgi:rhodanese-related sulfurtransferase
MGSLVSCQDIADLLATDRLFAVFDVRERGEYNECQIPGTTSLPRSQMEFRIGSLVPNRTIPITVYDDADGRAPLALKTLHQLGYSEVSILDGGLSAWRKDGGPTVSGVNVPSKAFGEKVHHERIIPDVTPEELNAMQQRRAELVILDVRTPEEYARFCIPNGINVPGGDLILWVEQLKQKRDTAVVVNCAGRTRSIIGTAALRRLGLTNVRALKNGTMGWVLAGLELETKPQRKTMTAPSVSRDKAAALAGQIALEEKLSWISAQQVSSVLQSMDDGVTYLIDVRSEDEFEAGHISGSINVPGGQAVQRADDFVAVRNAQIVFISNESARAVMAAYWYRQMGFVNVFVLQGGLRTWSEGGETLVSGAIQNEPLSFEAAKRRARSIEARDLERKLRDSATLVLDVGTSLEFESAHVPGAKWISRGWIELKLPQRFPDRTEPIVVTCPDGQQSVFAARALVEIGYTDVAVMDGGVRAWAAEGFSTERGLEGCLVQPSDVVLSPSIRGSKKDMQRYLDWERALQR